MNKESILTAAALLLLSACGGGGDDNASANETPAPTPPPVPPAPPPASSSPCDSGDGGVNWTALAEADCEDLSQYGLFRNEQDPSSDAHAPGFAYQLATELFSNYASKYRFIFLPEGSSISYRDQETLSFPTGTVLVKTFALPADTQVQEPENETLIETRLLIKRASGWTSLPYRWQDGKATLAVAGGSVSHTLNRQGESLTFDYAIPSRAECKVCHQQTNEAGTSIIAPIGVQPWLLNTNNESGQNQLAQWQSSGLITGLPELADISSSGAIADTSAPLQERAKGYLAVNCAHCHSDTGYASVSGLRLGFFVDHTSFKYGICKQPPGWDGGARGLDYDIVPGNAEHSIVVYRQQLNEPKDRMPPLGRAISHTEGVELVSEWIDSLPPSLGSCN
ncbi:hypothetical protein L2750_05580 [Shewanella submarina]|uniref:SO2930 family diheme c-type cytochrome n=1 Tax=Shewanella submarina TaxID=2016376 RepID=A0ABV7GC70_9GAMM|nr:SO2930 family diheme c-type cytochrome [Shewanella submarina]MCL1036622.1 hypothetical protein [Shewanella submarina]